MQGDGAIVRIEDAGDHPDECRFTGSVRAEQSEDASFRDGEAQVVHGSLRGIVLFHFFDFQDVHVVKVS